MKAVVLHEYGDVDQLRYEDAELPPVGDNEVRVRVRATSINPIDWKLRSGMAKERFPLDLPEILGRDLSGEVDVAGPSVVGLAKGMRVMGLANGTYAEYTTAKADVLCPIPGALSFEQAAALPLVLLTGTQLIERAVKISAGETILITGALGGVGRAAVHAAVSSRARVIAGVRESQREEASKLAVERVVALENDHEMKTVHDLDAVADTVGGPMLTRILKTLKDGGVYGSVIGGPKHPPERGIRVEAFMASPDASRLYELADEVARGQLVIPIAKTFPLQEIQEATRLAESGGAGGKIVLVV
jgi:NADPH:quinone reductase-like Zn-dependent oxidoreductase